MADSHSRVASALNYLTGEGVSYYPDGCDHSTLQALINDYFNSPSANGQSSDESDDSEGVASLSLHNILNCYAIYIDEQETASLVTADSEFLSEDPMDTGNTNINFI